MTTMASDLDRSSGGVRQVIRLSAAGGFVFVVSVVVQNILRSGEPAADAAPAKVASYFLNHRAAALIPIALFPLGMVAVVLFVSGIRARVRGDDGPSAWWARVGLLGTVALVALFAVVNTADVVLVTRARDL